MSIINSFPNGGDIATFANAFSRGDIIDTTERIVGMFMGKPMYQKVFTPPMPIVITDGTDVSTNYDVTEYNIDRLISSSISLNYANGKIVASPIYINNAGHKLRTNLFLQDNKIYLVVMSQSKTYNEYVPFVTLRYTKTTDTANTIKYGTGNDYSLDEQIVGTWIDGKPLYQKTIVATVPMTETDGVKADINIDVSSLKIDYVMIKNANIINATNQVDMPVYTNQVSSDLKLSGTFCFIRISTNELCIRNTAENYNGRTAYITLQYTKTTD